MTEITLYKHQQSAVDKFANRGQILAHEMGLGKTLTAASVGALSDIRCLAVCPARLKHSWKNELALIGENDVQLIETGKDVIGDTKWVIITYGLLDKFMDQIEQGDFKRVFLDESHYMKGKFTISKTGQIKGTKRAAAGVVTAAKIGNALLLTGTPVMNRPIELWNQLVAIGAEITKEMTRSHFSQRYCGGHLKQMGYRRFWWEDGATRVDELRARISGDMDIVKKADVLDLPEKVVNIKTIDFTPIQQKEYDRAWDEYLAWVEANPEYSNKDVQNVTNAKQLIEIGKLKQVTSAAKVQAVIDDIENLAPDEQLVILVEYVKTRDALNEALQKAGVSWGTLNQDGSVEKFQAGEIQVFTGNIVAAGTGLNLQNSNLLWIIDRNWVPAINLQAEDRIYRIGQEKKAFITYYEIEGTVDQDIKNATKRKEKVINRLMK
ncbi:DEAD/DEAH box helicase [Candidatus Babeliales bacterium]|nr:DEAD/DEAH box helicase [Candidatus Babeliales bacterium]